MDTVIRSAYDGKQREYSDASAVRFVVVNEEGVEVPERSMTKQEFSEECDINNIMKLAARTNGLVSHVNQFNGQYMDVSQGLSFQESMNNVLRGQEMFNSLPADIRSRFENDPGKFLDFVIDPNNKDEMRKIGLLKPEPAAPITAPAGSASAAPGTPA